jgi:hypothetical protein
MSQSPDRRPEKAAGGGSGAEGVVSQRMHHTETERRRSSRSPMLHRATPLGSAFPRCQWVAVALHANQQACPQLAERTRYSWWKRWGEAGVPTRMMEGLNMADATTVMLDTTDLKAQRTASKL